jgi:hypothetical protein
MGRRLAGPDTYRIPEESMIYIHIGRRKTGTTTIQKFLARNADSLAKAGVIYPTIARDRGIAHHAFGTSLLKRGSARGQNASQLWGELMQLAEREPGRNIVISTESLETVTPADVKKHCTRSDVRILCYMREASSHTQSAYSQSTKFGVSTMDFDTYFEKRHAVGALRYADVLGEWADAFGAENVRVRSMDKAMLVGEDLITDFLSAIGLDRDKLEFDYAEPDTKNLSPGWKLVELIRQAYQDALKVPALKTRQRELKLLGHAGLKVGMALELGDEKVQYLTPEQAQICRQEYLQDLKDIANLGIDARLAEPKPPEVALPARPFLPSAAQVPVEQAMAFQRALLPEVLRMTMLGDHAANDDDDHEPESEGGNHETLSAKEQQRAEKRAQRRAERRAGKDKPA